MLRRDASIGNAADGKDHKEFSQGIRMNETQKKLIFATDHLLQTNGLARVTTREIAREAGVAEGLIYHHFKDKAELIHAVTMQSVGDYRAIMESLPLQVGLRTVSENLEQVLQVAYHSHYGIVPIVCSIFADHPLRIRTLEIMKERDLGRHRAIEPLAAYLAAEQRLGRIMPDVVSQAAAKILWMVTFQMAMDDRFTERACDPAEICLEIREVVQTMMAGLEPRIPERQKTPQIRRQGR
jgi:AcrR family transcriptional regulator